jgi:hypothetical protein
MKVNPIRKILISASLVGCTLVGGAIGASLVGTAQAADDTSSTTAPAAAAAPAAGDPGSPNGMPHRGGAQFDPSKGGHVGSNGTKEELLTGDTAEKVKAAALAAVPGGTIQRVENDAEGSPYEAHMTKADGSQVTVKVDSNFKSTSVEDGPR